MGRVRSSDPDRIVYRSGGGCTALFGLPFLLMGLFLLFSPLIPDEPGSEGKGGQGGGPVVIPMLFGGVFASVGAYLAFKRSGTTLDKRMGTVSTWRSVLVPYRKTDHPLDQYDTVMVRKEKRESKNSTYTAYPVRIKGRGAETITIEEVREEKKARATGEEVAKFLGVRLADSSMGKRVVRKAEELDESIRERVERTSERPEVPDPPANRKCTETVDGDTLNVEIPGRGVQAECIGGIVVAVVFPLTFYFLVVRGIVDAEVPSTAETVMAIVVGAITMGIPFLWGLRMFISCIERGVTVEVSPRQVHVRRRCIVGTFAGTIPSEELEELILIGSSSGRANDARHIVARSDKRNLEFGHGLSEEELTWLRSVIWNVVSA